MITYKDRTFCNAGVLCKVYDCERRMTVADAEAARAQPFPVSYIDFTQADCFVPFFAILPPEKATNTLTKKKLSDAINRLDELGVLKGHVAPKATKSCTKTARRLLKRTPTGKKRTDFDDLVRQSIIIKKRRKKQPVVSKSKGKKTSRLDTL